MPNNSLQDQLGLWLAVQQSNQMTWSTWNVTNYTDFNGNQWIAVWAHKDFVPNINYDHTMDSVGYQGEVIPSWYINQSFSAPSAVSAPVSTTNIGIWDTFSGITPKKKGNIAESTTQVAPITPVTPQIPWAPLSRQDIIAKNAQQIADNYIKQVLSNSTGLVIYYKFNQGTPNGTNTGLTTLTNSASNSYHGTLQGFA